MSEPQPYGSWPSDLTATALTQGIKDFAGLHAVEGALFYLESRPEESGRTTLLLRDATGTRELTPAPFNVRSRVHEYGGGAFCVGKTDVFFVNFTDQNLYRLDWHDPNASPEPLSEGDASVRYADMDVSADQRQLAAVCERHVASPEGGHAEVINELVSFDLESGQQRTIHAGHDFYAAPRYAPDDTLRLAFVCWDHPNMPWDATELHLVDADATPGESHRIAGGPGEAVVQPFWDAGGGLHYASDRTGFWNPYVWNGSASSLLYQDEAEYGSPPWVFGMRDCIDAGEGRIIAVRQADTGPTLALIEAGKRQTLCSEFASYGGLCLVGEQLYFVAGRQAAFPALVAFDLKTHEWQTLAVAGELPVKAEEIATAEAMTLTNRHGLSIYANVYLPRATAAHSERPPLLVLSHGGPTAASGTALSLRIQYYTTRGWAVADVNYRGSTGYGRAYREALKNDWGIADVEDCEDVALALAAQGRVDPERLAIRGGSAGGYTTLAALTFGDTFKAGASHYGIGDIEALAADTHKFEARYVDNLIPPDQWAARSPINAVERLSCPVIFFQGTEDRVVPPNQAEAMVAALKAKSLPVAHVLFEGEGHGFRQAANIQRAAAAEYQFFCAVFGIECPDPVVELEIFNGDSL